MNPLNITLMQSRLCWRNPADNRAHLQSLLEESGPDSDVVIFPETFTTGFLGESAETDEGMDGATLEWMRGMAEAFNTVIAGSAVIEDQGRRNRFLWVEPDGAVKYYDKRHLFSYAGEDQRYVAGTERVVFEYGGWRICPQVCYDLRFPAWCRNRNDYDLLVVVANWPGTRIDAWSTLLKARAIENQSYVAAVNRVGKDGNDYEYPGASVIHDPLGETLVKLENSERSGTARVELEQVRVIREKLPFHREADAFEFTG